ncbi:MAG: methionine adenosyltransferase [Thermoprotei archaeon]|nr:MAG: methionine adenosyltransferase [Thermoprotei archaeon]
MSRNISIEILNLKPVEEQDIELVERKGLGHPDFIADSASEVSSLALSRYYLSKYGMILHHNVDKVLLVGGQAMPEFGGGVVLHPIYIIVSGRATEYVIKEEKSIDRVPIGTLVVNAVKDWVRRNFRFLDPERHIVVDYMIRSGSSDLVKVFELRSRGVPLANDTSFGIGYAPLSTLERLVLNTERLLNSREFKSSLPEVGEDVKVMGLRVGKDIKLTVAVAMISGLTPDLDHYLSVKEEVRNRILDLATKIAPNYSVEVHVNTADKPEKGLVYLTVTGTSAEHGDDGMTGRGNRANGLITPLRPMSLEATAGKNPVNHVGKLYNVLALRMAERVYKSVSKVKEVYVELLSQIGHPIDSPLIASAKVIPEEQAPINAIRSDVASIIDDELNNVTKLTDMILKGEAPLF